MRRVIKIAAATAATAALAFTATACGESSTEAAGKGNKGIGLAFDVGGRDDHSFNESAARGVDKAKEELGVDAKMLTVKNNETEADREQRRRRTGCPRGSSAPSWTRARSPAPSTPERRSSSTTSSR